MMNEMNKLVVIGLDGAPYNLILDLIKKQKLPTFKKLINDGTSGTLYSTLPPISPVAWTSMLTGLNPGKHGVFGFTECNSSKPISSDAIRGKSIFDFLSASGKKVVSYNVPYTHPPFQTNGIMISGFPTPNNKPLTYPAEFIDILASIVPDYRVDVDSKKNVDDFVNEIFRLTSIRFKLINYLLSNYEYDFFMSVITMTDRIQHKLYGYLYSSNLCYETYSDILINYYALIDKYLKNLIKGVSEDTYFILVSDHGFEPINYYVGSNFILNKCKTSRSFFSRTNLTYKIRKYPLIKKMLLKLMPDDVLYSVQKSLPEEEVFFNLLPFIKINITDSSNKENKKNEVIKMLKKIIDPEGNKIVDMILDPSEIYKGKHTKSAGDLLLLLNEGYIIKKYSQEGFSRPNKKLFDDTGSHYNLTSQKGIYILNGPGIQKGKKMDTRIINIAPTILDLMGLFREPFMDGVSLLEL